jgi:hypothetical protein
MMRWSLKDDNTRKPFIADGAVYLLNIRVGGNVECQRCAFLNENGDPLVLAGAQIAGDLTLGPGFCAHGRLNLSGLKTDRVCCMFNFVEADKKLISLDIRFADVATIYHDPDSWPKAGELENCSLMVLFIRISVPVEEYRLMVWRIRMMSSVAHFLKTGADLSNGCACSRRSRSLCSHTNSWQRY